MKKIYPLKLISVNKDIIWGGTTLGEKYNKPAGKTAEAWELAVHPEGICRIENGEYAGMLLSEYLGSEKFPIMIKLIDARDSLSVQVHPTKTEMWYIVEAEPGAKLVYGLKDRFDVEKFRAALDSGTVTDLLNYVPVKAGDVFFIPKGLVHAIGAGILIAEIQENSNVTYRVYDYGRLKDGVPRELHVDQAMKTIRDFTEEEIEAQRFSRGRKEPGVLADCRYFRTEIAGIDGSADFSEASGFVSVICLEGQGDIDGEKFVKGDSYFIPAGYGGFTVNGACRLLITTE